MDTLADYEPLEYYTDTLRENDNFFFIFYTKPYNPQII